MKPAKNMHQGFSIIEMILTLVLVGILAAMVVPYYQAGVTHSPELVVRIKASAKLQETMENIIVYTQNVAYNYYVDNMGSTEGDYAKLTATDLVDLQTKIDSDIDSFTPDGYAGTVTVKDNELIDMYDKSTPGLDSFYETGKEYLRVTLQDDDGGTLTYIFSTGWNYPRFSST